MLRCRWIFTGAAHHAHRIARHVRRFRRHHRSAWRRVCVSIGAPLVLGGGAAAGWGIGRAAGWWWGSPTLAGGWGGGDAWAASPQVVAVGEPSTLALLGAFVLLALALRP